MPNNTVKSLSLFYKIQYPMYTLRKFSPGILVSLLFLISCAASITESSSNPLLGKWSTSDKTIIEFKENGKATFDGTEILYTLAHDTLILSQGNNKIIYHYKIEKDQLEISGGDLKIPMQYSRIEGGSILSKKDDKKKDEPSILGKKEAASNNDNSETKSTQNSIYDTWISTEETIELKADGNCVYRGVAYKFKYDGNQIVVNTDKGDYTFGCKLSGNQLTLSTAQGSYSYYRKGTKPPATSGSRGGGQELVGKWCYMSNSTNISFNDCFTINGNGTYSYYSDNSMSGNTGSVAENSNYSGTWTYDGSVLYCKTYSGKSASYPLQKTYNKNGETCIVLAGRTYFTAYQHARW